MATLQDDLQKVLEINERFYRAFESLDMHRMEEVWAKGNHVTCIHPGWNLLRGWDSVKASWEAIFKNTEAIWFTLSDVKVELKGSLAWAVLMENILSETEGSLSATSVLATNIFEKVDGRWLIIHHHASHIFASHVQFAPGSSTIH